jgi:hypothetical protein
MEAPMLSSTMVRAPVRLMAMILAAQMSLGSRADGQANQIQAEPTRTAKERLGRKASDEQRVDNCKVPPALRGPKPRPDEWATAQARGATNEHASASTRPK